MSQKTQLSSLLQCLTASRLRCTISLFGLAVFAFVVLFLLPKPAPVAGIARPNVSAVGVTVVSAAGYGSTLAPESIAAAFGEGLAKTTVAAPNLSFALRKRSSRNRRLSL